MTMAGAGVGVFAASTAHCGAGWGLSLAAAGNAPANTDKAPEIARTGKRSRRTIIGRPFHGEFAFVK